jgi:hypothetical protein
MTTAKRLKALIENEQYEYQIYETIHKFICLYIQDRMSNIWSNPTQNDSRINKLDLVKIFLCVMNELDGERLT